MPKSEDYQIKPIQTRKDKLDFRTSWSKTYTEIKWPRILENATVYGPPRANLYSGDYVIITEDKNVFEAFKKLSTTLLCNVNTFCLYDAWHVNGYNYLRVENMYNYYPMRELFQNDLSEDMRRFNVGVALTMQYDEIRTDISKKLIKALHSIHSEGIVHNHITPDSVFINSKNSVKLSIFQISCTTDECPDVKDPYIEMNKSDLRNKRTIWKNYLKQADWYALFACIKFLWTGTEPNIKYIDLTSLPKSERTALNELATSLKLDMKRLKFNSWFQRLFNR